MDGRIYSLRIFIDFCLGLIGCVLFLHKMNSFTSSSAFESAGKTKSNRKQQSELSNATGRFLALRATCQQGASLALEAFPASAPFSPS